MCKEDNDDSDLLKKMADNFEYVFSDYFCSKLQKLKKKKSTVLVRKSKEIVENRK